MTEELAIEKPADTFTGSDSTGRVILYNDEYHTFDEVIVQLMKAISCTAAEGKGMAWTVHTIGKCEVFKGHFEKCLGVSAILEEIQLKTEIQMD